MIPSDNLVKGRSRSKSISRHVLGNYLLEAVPLLHTVEQDVHSLSRARQDCCSYRPVDTGTQGSGQVNAVTHPRQCCVRMIP